MINIFKTLSHVRDWIKRIFGIKGNTYNFYGCTFNDTNFGEIKNKSRKIIKNNFPIRYPRTTEFINGYVKMVDDSANPLAFSENLNYVSEQTATVSGLDQSDVANYMCDELNKTLKKEKTKKLIWRLLLSIPIPTLILIWISILGLESTNRPVISINKVWMSKTEGLSYQFDNFGGSPATFSFLLEYIKLNVQEISPKVESVKGTKIHTFTIYPNIPFKNFWATVQDSMQIDTDKFIYVLKIYWEYGPRYYEWIPGISKYKDQRYYIYFPSDKSWRQMPEPQANIYSSYFSHLGARNP
jgi:hypothetical protein